MSGRTGDVLRGLALAGAVAGALGAGWFVMNAPAPDVFQRRLRDGGRVVGVVGWPVMLDITGDAIAEVIFWRHTTDTLVAMDAPTADYVWETPPIRGGSVEPGPPRMACSSAAQADPSAA